MGIRGSATVVAEIETEVSGEEVEAAWTSEHSEKDIYDPSEEEPPPPSVQGRSQQLPTYMAEVRVEGHPMPSTSGRLILKSTVTIGLNGPGGKGVADEPYVVTFANGEVRQGTLDSNGEAELKNVPPCTHEVEWPRRRGLQRTGDQR